MKKLVVLTGSGMSAESGLKTFRDAGGLWEGYDFMQVASIDGWLENPELVLDFYNERRKQLVDAKPNAGHLGLAELEKIFDVHIITQNVDNLHERAASSNVLHLHGELTKACCTDNKKHIIDIGYSEIGPGDKCPDGFRMRPDIVWFGEEVPAISKAVEIVRTADIFVVIGTSLVVYPAAGLVDYVNKDVPLYLIDPVHPGHSFNRKFTFINENACAGVARLMEMIS